MNDFLLYFYAIFHIDEMLFIFSELAYIIFNKFDIKQKKRGIIMSNKKLILKLFICSTIFITFVFALHDKQVVAASSVNELENWSKWMQPIPDNIR